MSVFADSSALVKLYADEAGHQHIRKLQLICVSQLARVEVPAAIWRKYRMKELSAHHARILVNEFEADYYGDNDSEARFLVIAANDDIMATGAQLIATHGLRAYDAIQLASALALQRLEPDETTFMAFDKDLNAAAAAEGLAQSGLAT